eukprot:760419-Hanusia_phi.AAC.1
MVESQEGGAWEHGRLSRVQRSQGRGRGRVSGVPIPRPWSGWRKHNNAGSVQGFLSGLNALQGHSEVKTGRRHRLLPYATRSACRIASNSAFK